MGTVVRDSWPGVEVCLRSVILGQASEGGLAFSPLRLCLLVAWVYLCLYSVQRIQFSPLIRARHRTVATLATFLLGPLLPVTLIVVTALRQSTATGANVLDILRDCTRTMLAGVARHGQRGQSQEDVALLDASGRRLEEVYGAEDKQRMSRGTLRLTQTIVVEALRAEASDILIDPKDGDAVAVRYRIDGVLHPVRDLLGDAGKAVINSIKAVSNMDIAEKRRPQDGAFMARGASLTASFRVASAGVLHGEKLSIRVLNRNAGHFQLEDTGLGRKQCTILREAVARPSGTILVCGPTGSGKTTTLYALLNEIDRYTRNVITVEDPIEAVLENASQIEINTKADITFAKTLRSILRQDPDVICVGEIRDEETAEIALRAAQTGHLVLATMHCESNAAALVRLLDLGISPLLLASGLHTIFSQRLLRCLCPDCRKPTTLSPVQRRKYEEHQIDMSGVHESVGCARCRQTGYRGRTAVGDLLSLSDDFKGRLTQGAGLPDTLRTRGDAKGRSNLKKQALRKVVSGETTFAEVKRVLG